MEWGPIEVINPADREAVALVFRNAGFIVRQHEPKDGNIIYVKYIGDGRALDENNSNCSSEAVT